MPPVSEESLQGRRGVRGGLGGGKGGLGQREGWRCDGGGGMQGWGMQGPPAKHSAAEGDGAPSSAMRTTPGPREGGGGAEGKGGAAGKGGTHEGPSGSSGR